MATRRKTSSAAAKPDEVRSVKDPKAASDPDPPLAPPKLGFVLPLSAALFLPFFYLFFHYQIDAELRRSIAISAAMSIAGFVVTVRLIPVAARYVLRNLFGYDINKKGTPLGLIKVPESLGIVIGIVYLVIAILFQHFNFTADSNWLVEYNAALASICFMILLGFVDDVLDVPWRIKLVLPHLQHFPC
ncbi:UDP-N-acetylglucosamine--dolichyl-phosphate N-acetylglucosaminephosphotransferase-like [Iris pallida]|uniref:UDP-N-acetylglucosamine--dolichyl-phosphate N-acetylglucosaminephosphotransferase-like n=1 Tax=Iris pallida TaxID=29817 RepID=A0AAX6IIA1_IRIPA|nr:UDP-N-acetylglucosamine--dolichyl-phosphate N-acetylglucosaminephosphotransferase-like [Iris pallida]